MTEKVKMLAEETETIWYYSKYHLGDRIEMRTTDKIMMRRYEKYVEKYCALNTEKKR